MVGIFISTLLAFSNLQPVDIIENPQISRAAAPATVTTVDFESCSSTNFGKWHTRIVSDVSGNIFNVSVINGSKMEIEIIKYDSKCEIVGDFGINGTARATLDNLAMIDHVAIGQSNEILVWAGTDLFKFLANGQLDLSFGRNGVKRIQSLAYKVVDSYLSETGTYIFLARHPYNGCIRDLDYNYVVFRMSAEGVNDSSFGENGIAKGDLSGFATVNSFTLSPDGSFYLAGATTDFLCNTQNVPALPYLITKLNPDGSIDTSFGQSGKVQSRMTSLDVPGSKAEWTDIRFKDGELILCGRENEWAVVARFTLSGTLLNSYLYDARAPGLRSLVRAELTQFGQDSYLLHMMFQNANHLGVHIPRIVSMKTDLSLDSGFGTNGILELDPILASSGPMGNVTNSTNKITYNYSHYESSTDRYGYKILSLALSKTPNYPTISEVKVNSRNSATITWNKGKSTGWDQVSEFRVLLTNLTNSTAQTIKVSAPNRSVRLENLVPANNYSVEVVSVNENAISSPSSAEAFSTNFYTVNYSYNSATAGNGTVSDSFISGGAAITLPTPTRTGYTFAGWYSDMRLTSKIGDAGASYSPSGSTLALNAYAKWIRNLVKAVSTVKPTVTGTAKVSKTLTAKKGTWTGYPAPKVSYQWYVCKGSISAPRSTVPSSCKKINGATKSTFKIARAQKGKFISVLVTGVSTGTSKTTWLTKGTSKVS